MITYMQLTVPFFFFLETSYPGDHCRELFIPKVAKMQKSLSKYLIAIVQKVTVLFSFCEKENSFLLSAEDSIM